MHPHVYIIMCMQRLRDFTKCISVIINCLCRRTQENTTIWKNLASLSQSDTLLPTGIFVALFEEACVICGLSYWYSLEMVLEQFSTDCRK